MTQIIFLLGLIVWLLVCMVYDLRSRQVPGKLTLYPLIAAGIYGLIQGQWVAVMLMLALIFISDWEPRSMRLLFAVVIATFAIIFDASASIPIAALFSIWLLWEMNAMGGADAKLLMVIILVIGNPWVLAFIALAGGVQGLVGIMTRQHTVPYVVAIFAGTVLFAVNLWWVHVL
jgi:Flp pilus assembly protein protease CpaA